MRFFCKLDYRKSHTVWQNILKEWVKCLQTIEQIHIQISSRKSTILHWGAKIQPFRLSLNLYYPDYREMLDSIWKEFLSLYMIWKYWDKNKVLFTSICSTNSKAFHETNVLQKKLYTQWFNMQFCKRQLFSHIL